jgi:hypothetical protein
MMGDNEIDNQQYEHVSSQELGNLLKLAIMSETLASKKKISDTNGVYHERMMMGEDGYKTSKFMLVCTFFWAEMVS